MTKGISAICPAQAARMLKALLFRASLTSQVHTRIKFGAGNIYVWIKCMLRAKMKMVTCYPENRIWNLSYYTHTVEIRHFHCN